MISEKWQINLFGHVSARRHRTVISRFATRPTALLFVKLSLRNGHAFSRDELVELLWPECDTSTGRARLRVALSSLRRQLEPPDTRPGSVLVADRMSAALTEEGCAVDVVEYCNLVEDALMQASQRRAIACLLRADELYVGPFCDGFDADWIRDERLALTHLQVTGQMRLGQLLAQTGDISAGLKHARRAVQADPLSEPARRVLLRLIVASGHREEAERELEAFRRFLFREVGLEPAPETLRVLETPVRQPAASVATVGENSGEMDGPRTRPRQLPSFTDAYVERPEELSSLEALLCVSRLLVLTGPAGVGKTRLAVEVAQIASESFTAGIWFVSVPPEEPGRLIDLVANVLDPMRASGEEPIDAARRILAGSDPALVVIDGAESLPASASGEVYALLRAAPTLTLLVTSRRKLGVAGEQDYQVQPLQTPDDEATSLTDVATSPSVRLFVERTRRSAPDFQVNQANAGAISRICRSLDGIPMGIELAAAQVRRQPLAKIERELTGVGIGDRKKGSRSLTSAIASSLDSLSAEDHQSLLLLTVFTHDFDLAAAESVLGLPNGVHVLESLAENSLLIRQSPLRYRMLASIRDFGAKRLSAEHAAIAANRHASHYKFAAIHFASGVAEVGPYLFAPVDRDSENMRCALLWYLHHPELLPDFCIMVTSLTWFWVGRGRVAEGIGYVRQARQMLGEANEGTAGRLLLSEGILSCYWDDAEPAIKLLKRAIPALEPGPLATSARWALGFANYLTGAYDEARELLQSSLEEFERIGSAWWCGATNNVLGFTECASGHLAESERYFLASTENWRVTADRVVPTHNALGLARVYWKRGEYARAEQTYRECLHKFEAVGDRRGVAYAIEGLARVSASVERHAMAARLLGISEALRESQGRRLDYADSFLHQATRKTLEQALGSRFEVEWRVGHGLTMEAGVRYAIGSE